MGVQKEQALRNRQSIIDTASRVFRERGVDGVGVADLMRAAGFTHGGFYNHFKSKDALAAEACAAVLSRAVEEMAKVIEADAAGRKGSLRAMLETYLSPTHRDDPGQGCPIPTLAADASRQGEQMQAAYAEGIETFIQTMSSHFAGSGEYHGSSEAARASAIGLLTQLVGTLVLARGVGAANPGLSEEILTVGRSRLPD
jgi:TetR/AcrR family transcriptional repressor of nem operon